MPESEAWSVYQTLGQLILSGMGTCTSTSRDPSYSHSATVVVFCNSYGSFCRLQCLSLEHSLTKFAPPVSSDHLSKVFCVCVCVCVCMCVCVAGVLVIGPFLRAQVPRPTAPLPQSTAVTVISCLLLCNGLCAPVDKWHMKEYNIII